MSDPSAIFVGRKVQLQELNSHWRDALHKNQGKVVFLVGEAGIGKTSLVRQFSRNVLKHYSKAQYAYAQCDQIAGDISAYAPFIQILNSLTEQVAKRGESQLAAYLHEVGPDILGMIPAAGSLLAVTAKSVDFIWRRRKHDDGGLDEWRGQFGQQDIFQQFTDTLRNLARHKNPLLLFIDDWHWADASSTSLLFHLARQLDDTPLLLLATYRPHDAQARNHPIVNVHVEMQRHQLCADLSLDFLSQAEVAGYLAQRFPQAQIEPAFVEWLLDLTDGNALFVTEYVNLLLNEKLLTSEGQLAGDLGQITPPTNVEAVIRARLGTLDREARDMLAYGSVEGEQFTTLLLSRLLNIQPLYLISRLRAIEQTHQLIASLGQQTVYTQKTTVYRFVHTLIHRTLYNLLEAEERAEINRLLLELRGEIYAQADEATKAQLAPELMAHAAAAQDFVAEARYALVAAEAAVKSYAHAEVLKHCAVGLQALDKMSESTSETETLRIDLLLRRGWTEMFTGELQQALVTYHQVEIQTRVQKDSTRLFRVLDNLGWAWRILGNFDQVRSCYKEAISLALQMQDKTKLAIAYGHLSFSYWKQGDDDQALIWSQKALAIAEELNQKETLAHSYHMIGMIYSAQENYEQALAWLRRSITINKELGNRLSLAWNYLNVADIYSRQGDDDQAIPLYQQVLTIFKETGDIRGEGGVARFIGQSYLNQGNPDQALAWYQRAITIWEKFGSRTDLMWSYTGMGLAYYQKGEQDHALEAYDHSLALNEEVGNKHGLALNYNGIGLIYRDRGDRERALALFQKALTLSEEMRNQFGLAWSYNNIGLIHKDHGENEKALALFQKGLDIWQVTDRKSGKATTIHNIGTVYEAQGHYDQALDWYQRALAIREKLGNPKDIAETRERITAVEGKVKKRRGKRKT